MLDRETLAWTRHGLAGYVATTSLLREMGLDVSTETHQVLRHEPCLINQPGPQDAPAVLDSGCSVSATPFKEDFPGGIKETEDTRTAFQTKL